MNSDLPLGIVIGFVAGVIAGLLTSPFLSWVTAVVTG